MNTDYVDELRRVLSEGRLEAYRPTGGDDLATIATYFWNVNLCQSLYLSLGTLEIVMRNGIHNTLSSHFGREDWYDIHDLLLRQEATAVWKAKKGIRDANQHEIAQGRDPIVPGRVIASLTFGTWTGLLDRGYGGSPKGPQFWSLSSGLLSGVFPHAPSNLRQERANLHRYINRIRLLRNRVFHYEPIWNGIHLPMLGKKRGFKTVPVEEIHVQIIDAIGWVSPVAVEIVKRLDTFTDVYVNGRSQIESAINDLSGDQ